MRTTSKRLLILAACVTLAGATMAQSLNSETITIPVTGQTTDGLGLTYKFAGNVVFPKPVAAVTLPPGPVFYGLYSEAGAYLRTASGGDVVVAQGREFGATKGRIFWGVTELTVSSWTATAIKFTLPPGEIHPRGALLAIHRADGAALASLVLGAYQ